MTEIERWEPTDEYENDYLRASLEPGCGSVNVKVSLDITELVAKYGTGGKLSTYIPIGFVPDDGSDGGFLMKLLSPVEKQVEPYGLRLVK
jgi:hypothetical protein